LLRDLDVRRAGIDDEITLGAAVQKRRQDEYAAPAVERCRGPRPRRLLRRLGGIADAPGRRAVCRSIGGGSVALVHLGEELGEPIALLAGADRLEGGRRGGPAGRVAGG